MIADAAWVAGFRMIARFVRANTLASLAKCLAQIPFDPSPDREGGGWLGGVNPLPDGRSSDWSDPINSETQH